MQARLLFCASLLLGLAGPASGKGAAGRWRDAATGEHGDLIDLIRQAQKLPTIAEALAEARRFLNLSSSEPLTLPTGGKERANGYNPMLSIVRLVAESRPIGGTLAETYLRSRGIKCSAGLEALRFHPHCPYRDPDTGRFTHRPALLALVTDLKGQLTGIQRTYLSPKGDGKANVPTPRRSLGAIQSHGVRFGEIHDVGLIGEGVETILSLKCVLPTTPMIAALSADNLRQCAMSPTLRRLYVAVDPDPAGIKATKALIAASNRIGVHAIPLMPLGEDFNADLMNRGVTAVRRSIADQVQPVDAERLLDIDDEAAANEHLQASFGHAIR